MTSFGLARLAKEYERLWADQFAQAHVEGRTFAPPIGIDRKSIGWWKPAGQPNK